MKDAALFHLATEAREQAYAPYSGFCVGAALQSEDGTVYTGCNVESAAYSPTLCAERTALVKAVSEGKRRFTAIAVAGGPRGARLSPCPPCGVCRQMLAEFSDAAHPLRVILGEGEDVRALTLADLLPYAFDATSLS